MSSDEELDNYPYDLVPFPKYEDTEGRVFVDIILSSWTSFNRQTNKHEAKFPPEPYDRSATSELNKLLKTCGKPPDYWSKYEIEFRGRASK